MILGDKAFKNRPSESCGIQPLKNLKWYDLKPLKKFEMIWSVLNWSIVEYFVSLVCTCHVDYKSRPSSATIQFNILHTLTNELTNHFTNENTLAEYSCFL